MGLRDSLEEVENRKFLTLPELELRTLGRPASGQSLYQLRVPGSYVRKNSTGNCGTPQFRGYSPPYEVLHHGGSQSTDREDSNRIIQNICNV
jgi:hypothetical protein